MISSRILTIIASFCIFSMQSEATSDKKDKIVTASSAMPEPDVMPQPNKPDKSVRLLAEIELHPIQHQNFVHRSNYVSSTKGIDISHYQGSINWEEVARDENVAFVYIKCSESSGNVDNRFAHNLHEAHRVGIPVGCYHFFSPTASAITQFDNFSSVVGNLRGHDLIPVVDVEKISRNGNGRELCNRLKEFLKYVEDHYHVRPMIYTGLNFYKKFLEGNFSNYKFWIAKYAEGVPDPEQCEFIMWQYSATGSVRGIHGNVDCNTFVNGHTIKDILISNNGTKK